MNVLKIDRDCYPSRGWTKDHVNSVIIPVCKAHGITVLSVQTCRSLRKGYHLYISITPAVDAELANRLQFLLGDDGLRVSLNRARISAGLVEWSKLWWYPHRRLRTIYKAELPSHGFRDKN